MEKRKPIDIIIGINMTHLRKKFGLTQKEVCEVVDVNCSTYKHYELGDRMVPISVLRDLATLYKVSSNYFFEPLPDLKLSKKELMQLSNYAFNVDNSENMMQARARLRIKNFRIETKKNQKDLASFLGVDTSTYNKYEKGSRKLSNDVVRRLAEYYNVKVSDILD